MDCFGRIGYTLLPLYGGNVTRFYIVRHGESLGNLNRIFLGHTDWDLSEKGYEQAKMTAEALRDVHFDAIYSSDLLRALNTALPHAEMRGMSVTPSRMLRELYVGEWEGKSAEELTEKWGDVFTVEWRRDFGTFTPPAGESVLSGGKRLRAEIARIAALHDGGTVLVTSHAAVIRSFWAQMLGIEPSRIGAEFHFPSNASYSIVDVDGDEFTPIGYSYDEHMGDLVTRIDETVRRSGNIPSIE